MSKGARCKITFGVQTIDAEVLIGSDNRKSLLLTFDRGLWVAGGMYAGRIAVGYDEESYTYRDLLTGEPCRIDWGCDKCNAHFRGVEIFTLEGEAGRMVWNIEQARALVAAPERRDPGPGGEPQVVPDWMLDKLLAVNNEVVPEHLEHVDPTEPGIVAQRFGGVFLLDGTHRAHRAKRDGVPFRAWYLTMQESEEVRVPDMCDVADMGAHQTAMELRGVLRNNRMVEYGSKLSVELSLTSGEDPDAAEVEIRKHLTDEENAHINLRFVQLENATTESGGRNNDDGRQTA